eukprot:TRINITY_DN58917_c0_g1_i1.p1 TRINITY_DN58917_c0_g1~~TRINITY_DN58917_c0_g1_i1.p1  ORF type:complete len:369 (+),score=44.93 TRINITY_DN58917_c0_g1_i1:295-1401(+)
MSKHPVDGMLSDTVGTCVVQYKMPRFSGRHEVIENCKKMCDLMRASKSVHPDMDLIIFPESSMHGVIYDGEQLLNMNVTIPGPETELLSATCRDLGIWGVFSLTGEQHEEHPKTSRGARKPPYNTAILIDNHGGIAQKYHKIFPCCPTESSYPGENTFLSTGPKGLKISLIVGDDGNYPEIWRDCVMKGAELVVHCQGSTTCSTEHQVMATKTMAWMNNVYCAVSNASGHDGVQAFSGHSCIVSHDGRSLAECGTEENGIQYAQLSISSIRDARGADRPQNHLFNLLHRGYAGTYAAGDGNKGVAACPFLFYRKWVMDQEAEQIHVESFTRSTCEGCHLLQGQAGSAKQQKLEGGDKRAVGGTLHGGG